jgi:5-methyltetrahydropteroyltriglutamate--homocysteine methyltransferase
VLEALAAQERAGVDLVTDGEQRRDSFHAFVAGRLDGVRLMTLTELIELIDDSHAFERLLDALDVPAYAITNPTATGRIRRRRPLVLDDLLFLRRHTERPVKVTLPGPYLMTRSMWVAEVTGASYESKEELGEDVVEVLREELTELAQAGATFVQLDEPVLSELVFGDGQTVTFMCGALAARRDPSYELEFAVDLVNRVAAGFPGLRIGLHVCRGNWSRREDVLLSGSYHALAPHLRRMSVDQLVLEHATPRAGSLAAIGECLEEARELGLGVVNPRTEDVEPAEQIAAAVESALTLLPPERLFLNPDCGFATFANRALNSARVAEAKLSAMRDAATELRRRHRPSVFEEVPTR